MGKRSSAASHAQFDEMIERALYADEKAASSFEVTDEIAARFLAQAAEGLLPSSGTRLRVLEAVRQRSDAAPASSPHRGWFAMPTLRLRTTPMVVVLLIGVLVGGAYAVPILLPQVFGLNDPSAVEILQSGRAHDVRLSQRVGDVTIDLDRAYAGSDRIVVQFTIQSPPADPGQIVPSPVFAGGSLTLTDSAGRTYPVVRAVESPLVQGARWNGEAMVGVYSFSAARLPRGADRVGFRLTIAELRGIAGSGTNATSVTRVRGPWVFEFELPVSR